MGDNLEAQYEADLARAMALSMETHAMETLRRRESVQSGKKFFFYLIIYCKFSIDRP